SKANTWNAAAPMAGSAPITIWQANRDSPGFNLMWDLALVTPATTEEIGYYSNLAFAVFLAIVLPKKVGSSWLTPLARKMHKNTPVLLSQLHSEIILLDEGHTKKGYYYSWLMGREKTSRNAKLY